MHVWQEIITQVADFEDSSSRSGWIEMSDASMTYSYAMAKLGTGSNQSKRVDCGLNVKPEREKPNCHSRISS